jgi:hypothetical protein
MIKSWLCNTAKMDSVHKNTLIIVDTSGYEAMKNFPTKAKIVKDALPKFMQGSWPYGTRGYWRTTQNRVAVIGDILRAGGEVYLFLGKQRFFKIVFFFFNCLSLHTFVHRSFSFSSLFFFFFFFSSSSSSFL